MDSVVLVGCGSRGDNEPVLSLATALSASDRFTTTYLVVTSDYHDLVPKTDGFRVKELNKFNVEAFIEAMKLYLETVEASDADPVRLQCESIGAIVKCCVTPVLTDLLHLVEEVRPAAIIGTTLTTVVLYTIAQVTGIPGFILHMQPNTPVMSYPCYLSSMHEATQVASILSDAVSALNCKKKPTFPVCQNHEASYDTLLRFFTPSLSDANALRADLQLSPLSDTDISAILKGKNSSIVMVHTYPKRLIPRAPDLLPAVRVVGPLADDYIPPEWQAEVSCPQLSAYLKEGKPPLCVNIGSMSVDSEDLRKVTFALLSGLRSANVQRILLLVGSGASTVQLSHLSTGDDENASLIRWSDEHVFECAESAQFAWLFPQCMAVISHGGAGSVAAALRAGIPIALAPLMADQFFWAELITRSHLGTAIRPSLADCSTETVKEAVYTILSPEVIKNAKAYGAQESELRSGADEMVDILKEYTCR